MRSGRRRLEALPIRLFQEAARGRCQMCKKNRATQAHHVVYRQHLRAMGEGEWSPRNAMGLCRECHEAHHNRSARIPLRALSDDHLAYAFEIMGGAAHGYLIRRYGGADDRLEEQLAAAIS